ncbi:hypothetical protein [Natronococcus wangiae]|uniref:hypothetical protein n=1 Tax=Natronococcus wangiae TaxID=3068275 RepID=UPI00273F6EC5|nr:hypothetical protein [Natronococcus sp. AD5]
MSQLTIPPDAGEERASELVREHVEIGDVVEIRNEKRTEEDAFDVKGTVTSVEPGYLELDEKPPTEGSVRYDEIHTITKIESK